MYRSVPTLGWVKGEASELYVHQAGRSGGQAKRTYVRLADGVGQANCMCIRLGEGVGQAKRICIWLGEGVGQAKRIFIRLGEGVGDDLRPPRQGRH